MSKSKINLSNKIIVIGGGSFQGKSLISVHVGHKFNIPLILCTDSIRNILHILDSKNPYFFSSTYLMPPENLLIQMREISRVLQGLLKLYSKRGENIIIEGMHLSKKFIDYLTTQSNVLVLCIDNGLSLEKRLEYKSITRHRVEYLDPDTNEIKYGELTKDNLYYTPYMNHATRIKEIHIQIVNYFHQNNLPVIRYKNLDKATQIIEVMINDFLNSREDDK